MLHGMSCLLPHRDRELVQIVNAALADSAARSGKWLACRPGCSQCCVGVFAINQLDAVRLRKGLAELEARDPDRAERVRARTREAVERLSPAYPGDIHSGVLDESAAPERWDDFANDEICPALDPETKTCDLYEFRPVLCRTFGPPILSEGELGVCELCFDGASEEEVAACEMRPQSDELEKSLVEELERESGLRGETIVAFALAG